MAPSRVARGPAGHPPNTKIEKLVCVAEAIIASGGETPPLLPETLLPDFAERTMPSVEGADVIAVRRAR